MLFTSFPFLIFIFCFFSIYFLISKKNKNLLLLISSLFFYGWWDYRFLFLLVFSIVFDFFLGNLIDESKDIKKRKKFLYISVFLNLAVLCIFKYLDFFAQSLASIFEKININFFNDLTFNIILPIGISFYTFQKLSYIFDLYNKKCKVEKDFITFASYVSLFPQLIAGPILRAHKLLPQLKKNIYPKIIDGLLLVLWGFFLKLCLADTLSIFVDVCFDNTKNFGSLSLLIGSIFFSFQIYGDFAGYSLIAIGLGKIMGFDFGINFNSPYFANSFRNFWQRWHISLSTWFRDYVYIKLGGKRNDPVKRSCNVLITMILAGLWHGANLTFILWGFLHALLIIIQNFLSKKFQKNIKNPFVNLLKIFFVFFVINALWILFRSNSIEHANMYINEILKFDDFFKGISPYIFYVYKGFFLIFVVLIIDFLTSIEKIKKKLINKDILKIISLLLILLSISFFGTFNETPFIYFQF